MQIAEAFVAIRPKIDPNAKADIAKAGQQAGTAFADGVTKDAQGRLRDQRGKFVTSGQQLGEGVGQGISKGVKSQTSEVVKDLGAVFALFGAGRFLKSAFAEATEATRATAQVGAVLKSTGAEAGVSADHVDRLAQSESDKIAVDDDVIKRGEAMLLTFRSVRNEVGAGNQIFDRGTKAAADMAAVYGNDLQGAVVQVGKALEDPILGLTALRRVGVEFTAQQRDQIKALVQSGDLLGAQKIILGELEKEFGGAAQKIAAADPFQRFNVDMQQFKETVGKDALPAASGILGVVSNFLDVFGQAPAPIRGTAEALVGLGLAAATFSRFSGTFGDFRTSLAQAAEGEGLLSVATTGLKTALVGLAVAGVSVAVLDTVIDNLGKKAPSVERLTKAADAFAKSKIFDGALGESLGGNADKIGNILSLVDRTVNAPGFGRAGTGLNKIAEFFSDPFSSKGSTEVNTARSAIHNLDASLAQLAGGGHADEAKQVFDFLNQSAVDQGRVVDDLISNLPNYKNALKDVELQQKASAGSAQTLNDRYVSLAQALITPLTEKLGVEDALATAAGAARDLKDAKDEAAGTGPKSLAAAQAEKDAQKSLAAAYDSSAESVRHLQDAQAKLAEFDNATSQRIRDLERLQITRRVITSPEEARQKQIDLLKFDQDATDKRRDLQGQVTDAEHGVARAADSVRDAQNKVADAAKKRRAVQVEAAGAIEGAERKAEEAVLAAGTALSQFAQDAKPGDDVLTHYVEQLKNIALLIDPKGDLVKNFDAFLAKGAGGGRQTPFVPKVLAPNLAGALDKFVSSGGVKDAALFNQIARGGGPISIQDLVTALTSHPQGVFSPQVVAVLRKLGVPGYEFGGIVPGALGEPRLIVAHGGEEVVTRDQQHESAVINQNNHFYGNDHPSLMDVEWSNHLLAKMVGRRRG